MLKNNTHLIPVAVLDLVNKMQDKNINENERMNYQLRVEAIRDFCSQSVMKHISHKPVTKKNTRVVR